MSRVVDIKSEFRDNELRGRHRERVPGAVQQSVLTLQLLRAIEFDASTQTWHLAYEVLEREVSGSVNQFLRTLYLTLVGATHS